jgi:hypothetical protein
MCGNRADASNEQPENCDSLQVYATAFAAELDDTSRHSVPFAVADGQTHAIAVW